MPATIVGPLQNVTGAPNGSFAALNLTTAQVVKAAPGVLYKVVCVVAGSITLNDLASTSGSAAANTIFTGSVTAGQVIELDWPCLTGIAVTAITTAQVNVSYS
jgi:hypothetical protein